MNKSRTWFKHGFGSAREAFHIAIDDIVILPLAIFLLPAVAESKQPS